MANILGVGIATLDIINIVDGYPEEDAEVRALNQRVCRGGNAANSLAVLAQLGHRCSWAGTVAAEADGKRILRDLKSFDINVSASQRIRDGRSPTSYICLNQQNGSRTIVHYRDLPEYSYSAFAALDLTPYHWIHFEGRNVADTRQMLERARKNWPNMPISLELEKPRPDIEVLLPYPQLLLFSRHFARSRGFDDAAAFLETMKQLAPQADLVCAWGDQGAYGCTREGQVLHSPAFPPPNLVDTIGAGDVFNASIIDQYLKGVPLATALTAACRLAGQKCGQLGLHFLAPPTNTNETDDDNDLR